MWSAQTQGNLLYHPDVADRSSMDKKRIFLPGDRSINARNLRTIIFQPFSASNGPQTCIMTSIAARHQPLDPEIFNKVPILKPREL